MEILRALKKRENSKYDGNSMLKAAKATVEVRNNTLGVRASTEKYGIPLSILGRKNNKEAF